jgi:hypothetical protein
VRYARKDALGWTFETAKDLTGRAASLAGIFQLGCADCIE